MQYRRNKMNKWTLFVILLAVVSAAGCGKKEAVKMPEPNQPTAVVKAEPLSVVDDYIPDTGTYGTVTQCPVMGEKIVVGKDTNAVKYKGKIYYLCCPTCLGQFKQNPDKYAK